MRIHHLNCGTMCPLAGSLFVYPTEAEFAERRLVCQCLLLETETQGLVLVDTGLGLHDVRHPESRIDRLFRTLDGIRLRERETAVRQIERLGFRPADVRHIVLTHLDFDHAGGIDDFPDAKVHVLDAEYRCAKEGRRGFVASRRYSPSQWDHDVHWRTYASVGGDRWFGFEAVRKLDGLPPEILLVPLVGHSRGHCGVAVDTGQGWLLHAGDSYFHHGELAPQPRCPIGLRFYEWLMQADGGARHLNQDRLRLLARKHEVEMFCSHDASDFIRFAHRSPYGSVSGGHEQLRFASR